MIRPYGDRLIRGRPLEENILTGGGIERGLCPLPSPSPTVLERQERTAFLLLVAVCAIVAGAHLVLTGIGKAAFASPFSSQSREGDLVSLQGIVEQATVTQSGNHLLLRVDGIPVFVPASARGNLTVLEGDRMAVLGTVRIYQGEKEIVVQAREDIRILP
jgi:hypothetical protein